MARARKVTKIDTQPSLFDQTPFLKTAPCVPALRRLVADWRESGYKGATETTRTLLNFWFFTDHKLPTGQLFTYHEAQREAIETLIYVYEVAKVRNRKDLLEQYATTNNGLQLPGFDEFARYATKMATGSGKTKVMSLAIVWQYFNAVREDASDYAKTFLILAPNVIVFERLKSDFEDSRIFNSDPLIPREFKIFWEFDCIMRGERERALADGILFLTNIQQLYDKTERKKNGNSEPDIMTEMLGPKPKDDISSELISFTEMLAKRDGQLLVCNDEAHHTHDEENEWNNVIRRLHTSLPIASQLDFSATPRFAKGGLFPWVISDYPIRQAIIDGIVKRPVKGITELEEAKSPVASVRYEGYLTAGVERWREYKEQLSPLNKKPLLFIMMNTTEEAEDVGDWLRKRYPSEFGGDKKVLVIHTDKSGEITKKDLNAARKLAREVDYPDNPTNAIVSVLMLREGWDVQNVTVVVGLRPYTAAANILPEQAIGRGLRLMFRGKSYSERVDIIGNKAFLAFVDDLEKLEDIKLDTFEPGKDKLKIITIAPKLPDKAAFDLSLPRLSPMLTRKKTLAEEIGSLDITRFRFSPDPLPRKPTDADIRKFQYQAFDILTMEKLFEREYAIKDVQRPDEIVSYYAKLIAVNLKLPGQFSSLAPKVWEFFEKRAFGEIVALNDSTIIKAMNHRVAGYVVLDVFGRALKEKLIEQLEPSIEGQDRLLSAIEPFAFSRSVLDARKCVLNLVPCDNDFEYEFAKFLENAKDVQAFSKLPQQFGFSIEYTDNNANLRYYYPDFVVKTDQDEMWLVETKGQESLEVQYKDRAANLWCENATQLTGQQWHYVKVPQKGYDMLQPVEFSDLLTFVS
ncbi:type III restriction endonuclease subunit R [Ktedonobacter sp. SOSP1-52]|uniref:DEAD/DEAH box helicase family protein n=1 Tax=Ktedonobacter sp. SOSP1-52 TaxID=2778366 RepID=UPI001915F355|nr:DEAD/DEAH box helicase family protein [Ktedonobacter sp. SOSP1-52]GHO69767.1 type III restriction endonuclease subunit R [Ktedonobacter sp. SOSP1-52]